MTMTKEQVFKIAALVLAALALFGLTMIVLDTGWWISYTGLEMLEEGDDYALLKWAVLIDVTAIVVLAISLWKDTGTFFAILASLGAMLLMYLTVKEDMDYLASGYYWFQYTSLGSAVCSAAMFFVRE